MMYAPPGAMQGGQPEHGQPAYGPGQAQQVGYFQEEGTPTPAPVLGGEAGAPMGPMEAMPMMPDAYGPTNAEDFGGDCPYCGGAGCGHCSGHNGLLGDVLGIVGPYPDGGCGAVRWYDLSLDY